MTTQNLEQLDLTSAITEEQARMKQIVFTGLLESPIRGRLPESIFVNYFLPHFLGQGTNPNWVVEWISIAGTPMTEVDIFNDQTGEHLFVVPGYLNTSGQALQQQDGNVSDIIKRAEMIGENNPIEKLTFASRALYSKQQEYLSEINREDVNNKWYYILKRYGLITDIPGQPVNPSTPTEDYFEF